MLLAWLKFLSLMPHDFDFGIFSSSLDTSAQVIIFPLLGTCAMALAARGERLGIATMLIAIPTMVSLFYALSFLIGVLIYGS